MRVWLIRAKVVGAVAGVGVLAFWAARRLDQDGLVFDWPLAVLALGLNQAALAVLSSRMRWVLRIWGTSLSFADSFRINLQSLFYFFFVPMSVGLEIARYVKIKRAAAIEGGPGLVLAMLMDRALGALAALVTAAAVLPWVGALTLTLSAQHRTALSIGVPIALAVTLAALYLARRHLGGRIREVVVEAMRRRRELAASLVVAVAVQVLMGLTVWAGARAVGIDIGVVEVVFGVSAAMLAMLVPLTFVGAGPAEAAGVVVFLALGASMPEAVMITTLGYLGRLIGALQGGIWEGVEGGLEAASLPR